MRLVKRDVVLWLRHLQEAGMPVPAGCSAVFRVGDVDILFQPMRPGPSGRPTQAYAQQEQTGVFGRAFLSAP